MTATVDRILKHRDLHAMVALDSIDAIAERVRNLLSHGRRITVARRYTYVDSPPEVHAGLTVDYIDGWNSDHGKGFAVHLKPGLTAGFGFSAHAGKSISDDPFKRRRNMTEVTIKGGLPGDGPAREDLLVIRHWNNDGVCDERVIAFDYGPDRQQIREDMAKHLWVTDGGDPGLWDKLADAAFSLNSYNRQAGSRLKLEGAEEREKFLARAGELLAIAGRDG